MQRTRQHAGIPTGGQFAERNRSSGSVTLNRVDPVPKATATTALSGAEAIAVARMMAGRAGRQLNKQDLEDVAQDAITSILTSVKHGTVVSLTPGLITAAIRNSVVHRQLVNSGLRHEDASAIKKLESRVTISEQDLGRHLSEADLDALAQNIRETWKDQRHKPSAGFHRRITVLEMAGDVEDEALRIPADEQHNMERTTAGDLASQVENGDLSTANAKRKLWNALATDWDVPQAEGNIRPAEAERIKAAMRLGGGVAEALDTYWAGMSSTATSALFAPFGEINAESRVRVFTVLAARPAFADRIWEAALASATRPGKSVA
jgi:hypothetical protein